MSTVESIGAYDAHSFFVLDFVSFDRSPIIISGVFVLFQLGLTALLTLASELQ